MGTIAENKNELRAQLQEGIGEAISALKEKLAAGSEKADSLFLIESQWLDARKRSLHGTLSQEQFMLTENQVRERLLNLINELEAEDLSGQVQPKEPATVEAPPKEGEVKPIAPEKKRYWLYVILAVVLGVIIWRGVVYFGDSDEMPPAVRARTEGAEEARPHQEETEAEPETEAVEFAGGSRLAYRANFREWPTEEDEHGSAQPVSGGARYALEAYSNTWTGVPKKIQLEEPINRDFIFELSFEAEEGSSFSINFKLQDDGEDYSTMRYYLRFNEYRPEFIISEGWIEDDFYSDPDKEFRKEGAVPDEARASIRMPGTNLLSVKRTAGKGRFYLNNHLIAEAKISVFPIRQFSLGLAGESRVVLHNVEARIPN